MVHESIFFSKEGEKGLNLTSAAHLCALAAQQKEQYNALLESLSFVNEEKALIGTDKYMRTASGCSPSKFAKITAILNKIAEFNAFISWFSEARKYLEAYKRDFEDLEVQDWAATYGVELPTYPENKPTKSSVSSDDIIKEMSIKDRQTFLALEARASVLGKFIHLDGPYEAARKRAHKKIASPYSTNGDGRDTLVLKYELSVPIEDIDKKYNELQKEYRAVEQQLNHMKADILKKRNDRNIEIENENQLIELELEKEKEIYFSKKKEIASQFSAWKIEMSEELSKIKLAIPNALADMVTYLNNLDK